MRSWKGIQIIIFPSNKSLCLNCLVGTHLPPVSWLALCFRFFPLFPPSFVFLSLSQCLSVSLLLPSSNASFSAIVLKKLGCRGSEMNKNVILTVPIVCSHLFLLYRFISGGKLLAGREDASQNDIYFIVQGGSPACFHVTQILEL